MEKWSLNDWAAIPRTPYLLEFFLPVTKVQFCLSTLLIDISTMIVVFFYITLKQNRLLFIMLLAVQSILFLNVFNHLFMVFLFLQYQPGIFTAIIFNIPFSIYFFFTALREDCIDKKLLLGILVLSALFYPVSAGFFLLVSKLILSVI